MLLTQKFVYCSFLRIVIFIPWMGTSYVEENIVLNTHITQTHVFAMDWKDGQNTIGFCDNIDLELLAGNYLFMEEDSRSWVELGA